MKKFVLIVQYGTGSMCMLTDTPDILEATKQFKENYMKCVYGDSKSSMQPDILKAEILPLVYSGCGVDKNECLNCLKCKKVV